MADADLRPMSLGEVLDRTFKLYRNHFWLFAGITALPSGVLLLFRVVNSAWTVSRMGQVARGAQFPSFSPATLFTTIIIGFVSILLFCLMAGYAQGATVYAVSDLYLGGRAGLRDSYRRVGMKAFRVLGIFLCLGIVLFVAFLLFIIPGIILGCRVALAVPVEMLENSNPFRSIERSIQLTKGHGMQIFVILLLVVVLFYVIATIFQIPFMFAMISAAKSQQNLSVVTLIIINIGTFLAEVIVGPIATVALSLMYYNLRVRKEAFDIQHQIATLGTNPTLDTPSAV
jgi:Membrane domain of glycerophosphoryl diester phosphodiesterase